MKLSIKRKGNNMPSETFNNLSEDKKERIITSLKNTFAKKSIFDASVKEVVEDLNIARGSFYQYFEDLEDAYFMILDRETVDIHHLFQKILRENDFDIFKSLEIYGKELQKILFEEENYSIYKNRFLHWTCQLESKWQKYKRENSTNIYEGAFYNREIIHFVKAVVHDLIERNYIEGWTKDEFLEKFQNYIDWLKGGIKWD